VICSTKHSLTKDQRRKFDPQIVAFLILLNNACTWISAASNVAQATTLSFLQLPFPWQCLSHNPLSLASLLTQLYLYLVMVASSTGALFLDIYFRESIAMSVLFVIFAVGQLFISTVYAYLWTLIAIRTSKLSRNKKVNSALTVLRIVLFSQFGLASAVCTGAALAVSIMDPGFPQQGTGIFRAVVRLQWLT
jgi:hypothetical protein